jgi:hypothetical protein
MEKVTHHANPEKPDKRSIDERFKPIPVMAGLSD